MKTAILTVALLAAAPSALAQPTVSGGAQLQQIPPAPVQPKSIPDIRVERGQAPTAPEAPGPRFVVRACV
ncbi:MAG TPA: hypothetical protein VFE10_16030 [Phenylobacterium sp.]|nr:hypothetical protein [Phenylobacterium sp.]